MLSPRLFGPSLYLSVLLALFCLAGPVHDLFMLFSTCLRLTAGAFQCLHDLDILLASMLILEVGPFKKSQRTDARRGTNTGVLQDGVPRGRETYRVTRNFYITMIILFRIINFGIALHSPYRKYFFGGNTFALHYIILTATLKLHLHYFPFKEICKQIDSAIHYIMVTLKIVFGI